MTGAGAPMPARAALLRGVNVGGTRILPMADLRESLSHIGLDRPETILQSGNVVFGSGLPDHALAARIGQAIADRFGFRPDVFLLDRAGIGRAIAHPFGDVPPERVHAFFLSGAETIDDAALAALAAPSERWRQEPGLFRLCAPDGIGRSRLAAALPRLLGGTMTARNLRTLCRVAGRMATREGK